MPLQTAKEPHVRIPRSQLRLGTDIFLDTSDLVDLRNLYDAHLADSEVVVFLGTPTALTPYVLIE